MTVTPGASSAERPAKFLHYKHGHPCPICGQTNTRATGYCHGFLIVFTDVAAWEASAYEVAACQHVAAYPGQDRKMTSAGTGVSGLHRRNPHPDQR